MKRDQVKLGTIIIITLLLAGALGWASSFRLWLLLGADCAKQTVLRDTDHDGAPELYELNNRHLRIYEDNQLLWQSNADWMVQSFAVADVNNDAVDDLLIIVWKPGNYGPDKPFWVQRNDRRFSCHLFMYNVQLNQIKPLWMSSALDGPIKKLEIADLNNDGKNELVVQQGDYSVWAGIKASLTPPEFKVWQWKGWGFYRMD